MKALKLTSNWYIDYWETTIDGNLTVEVMTDDVVKILAMMMTGGGR